MSDDSEPGAPLSGEHVLGNPEAPVAVVEYGDYECPYCAAAAPVLRELIGGSDGGVQLVFRNFPLVDVHPYALTAALAAEATAPHGVFWEMHDALFAGQGRLADADLRSYAESVGVPGELVTGDAAQPFGDKVEDDFTAGVEQGVRGTPTLLIDDDVYRGRMDLMSLRQATRRSVGGGGLPPRSRRKGLRSLVGIRRTQR